MEKEKTGTENILPNWFVKEIKQPFAAGISHEFIIHGDINSLVANPETEEEPNMPYISLRKFFEKLFDQGEMVIFYNIASGVTFLTEDMEKNFRKISGLEADSGASSDPIAAAKAGLMAKRSIPREAEACFPMIEKVLKTTENVAVIINSVHFIAPSSMTGATLPANERTNIERLKNWAEDEDIRDNNNLIFLLTDLSSKVSEELRQNGCGVRTVFIPKPEADERKKYIKTLIEGPEEFKKLKARINGLEKSVKISKSAKKKEAEEELAEAKEELESYENIELFKIAGDLDLNSLTIATQGMNLRQIFEVFMTSKSLGNEVTLKYFKEKKLEILNNEYGDVMEIVDPELGLENIGGMEHVKDYFLGVLDAIKNGEVRLIPMGVTLMGPPGTGKTALVEALAKESGYLFVKVKNLRSMWVGASEERGEKLGLGLRSIAPVIVMNDEADLAEAGRDAPKGDSGVSERLMKMWMELLSDPKILGKIIVISCTNRPDRIDAALLRSGRSDERILLPMPHMEERKAIFKVMYKRFNIPADIRDFTDPAKMTDGLSGADIMKISKSSFSIAFRQGKKAVDLKSLKEAIEDFIPGTSQPEIDFMTMMAILACSSRSLLPKNIKEIINGIRKRKLIDNLDDYVRQIKARNIIEINGEAA